MVNNRVINLCCYDSYWSKFTNNIFVTSTQFLFDLLYSFCEGIYSLHHISAILHRQTTLVTNNGTVQDNMLSLPERVAHQCVNKDVNLLLTSMSTWFRRNMSLIFSSNSETDAWELLENLEEMFPRYL